MLTSGGRATRGYGWVPTSALANMPAPTDDDCRLGDDPVEHDQFHADPKDDCPHFFNVK